MTHYQGQNFILTKDLHFYTNQINFIKRIAQTDIKETLLKEKYLKQIQKLQKVIKTIKKQMKELKLSNLELTQIYRSNMDFIQCRIRQLIYPLKIQKTDFQFYMLKRQYKQQSIENKCGISMNIDTEKYDNRMLIDINLSQIIDIQYHRFSLKSLILKSTSILKSFKYHPIIYEKNTEIDMLIHKIAQNYNAIPYHNFTHSFSVFSMFYYFSKTQKFRDLINDFDLYWSLVACLGHDLRHSGFNSVFQGKTKSQIAMNFGNISILQKMHRNVMIQILQTLGENSPLLLLDGQQKKLAKKIITNCIMATDMSKHYDYVSIFKQKNRDYSKQQDKILLMEGLIHSCDIGNSMLDYENYITWANLVCVQFHQQTIEQKNHGIQLTNHMRFDSLNYFYKNQNTFLNTIVVPMWQTLNEQVNQKKIQQKLLIIKQNAQKVSQHMRRNSHSQHSRSNLSKYLQNILKQIKN